MRLRLERRTTFLLLALVCALLAISTLLACAGRNPLAQGMKLERAGDLRGAIAAYQKQLLRTKDRNAESELYLRIGECLWAMDRPVEAFSSYQKAVNANARNAVAQLRLGQLYLVSGAPESAADLANGVLRASQNNPEALALLGSAAVANGDDSMAERAFVRVLQLDSSRTNIAVALAEIYNRAGETEKARNVLKHTAQQHPQSSAPWLALGRLEEQEGQVGRAELAYRNAVSAEDTPDTNLRLAQFLERSARVAEAEQVLRRVDQKRPENPTALGDFQLISGKSANAAERYIAAMDSAVALHGARRISRENAVSQIAARMIEADLQAADDGGNSRGIAVQNARRRLDEYRSKLDHATVSILETEIALTEGDVRKAQIHANAALTYAPESAAAHYISGVVRWKLLDRPAARSAWDSALENESSFVPARLALTSAAIEDKDFEAASHYIIPVVRDEPANYQALVLFAKTLAGQKSFESAKVIARRAMVVDPQSATPQLLLGQLAEAQDQVAEAFLHYQRAITLEPRSQEAIEALTTLYRKGQLNDGMIRKVEEVAEAEPRSATLMEIAGRLYADRGKLSDARRCLARAIQLDPTRESAALRLVQLSPEAGDGQAPLWTQASSVLAGLRAQDEGRFDVAIQHYEAAVRNGDASGTASNNLAWIYAEQGKNLDRALQLAQEARERDPRNPAVLDTLGFVYLKRREYTQAVQVLEAASRAENWNSAEADASLKQTIRQHLGEAYRNSGQTQQAEDLYAPPPRPVRIAHR